MQYNVENSRGLLLSVAWCEDCINGRSRLRHVDAKIKEQQTRLGRKDWIVILTQQSHS